MHMSASEVRVPWLPSAANGFASGVELIQKDFVGLGAGRLAGGWELCCLRTCCAVSPWFKGTDNLDIGVDRRALRTPRERGTDQPRDSFRRNFWQARSSSPADYIVLSSFVPAEYRLSYTVTLRWIC
jgi:hypothetical protein